MHTHIKHNGTKNNPITSQHVISQPLSYNVFNTFQIWNNKRQSQYSHSFLSQEMSADTLKHLLTAIHAFYCSLPINTDEPKRHMSLKSRAHIYDIYTNLSNRCRTIYHDLTDTDLNELNTLYRQAINTIHILYGTIQRRPYETVPILDG
jgi:hypothetical protein